MEDTESQISNGKHTPPKDFVCPITTLIFDDPVTLETGQTYERKAIQEWFDRGNYTCPITHQKLHNLQLPKTNYVLKRLIASWKELTPCSDQFEYQETNYVHVPQFVHDYSHNVVINQTIVDGNINELRLVITDLCTSQVLKKAELAVLKIERFWQEAKMEGEIQNLLSKPPVVNGFVEILFNSVDTRVLKATVFLLCEMGSRDYDVISTLTRVYSDVECIISLFKNGLFEAVVLIYLLRTSISSFLQMDMVNKLLTVVQKREDEFLKMCMNPKAASVILLAQIIENDDDNGAGLEVIKSIISGKAIDCIIKCLELESTEERIAAIKILLRCIQEDGKCRNSIANKAELAPVLECFLEVDDRERFEIVQFLSELVKLNREEAIDNLISCLKNSDSPSAQLAAADTLLVLQGRFSYSGKPLVRRFLLKRGGIDKNYRSTTRSGDDQETMEEEKVAQEWEKKMAFVLVNHEAGLIFEALAEGLKSRHAEICMGCFVSATWLLHMLTLLPEMGIQEIARACLLKRFVSIFKSAKDAEDKTISMLALSSFIHDPDGLRDINIYKKDISKGLREFKKSSTVAFEMLKVFSEGSDSSIELWNHRELAQEDCSINGVVLSTTCYKDKIFTGHSDGTIKVWSINKEDLFCEEVYYVKEHVNNLLVANNIACFIPQAAGIKVNSWSGESKLLNPSKVVKCLALVNGRLYSGCLDNSIQDIDLATGTLTSVQSGSRKLLAKGNRVNVLQVHDGLIYAASSSMEGTAFKIWNASTYNLVESISLTSEVRTMTFSSEFIYFGCKSGIVEVWCRNKLVKKETLQIGTNCKVMCMAMDNNEDILVIGTSDGRLQVWGVS
ncbi:hypothetical protein L1987_31055 [Smallanthus sonchifolius]|uniref:Uncharacterized protein n=1 Tax=Smallanthus sonchifolius TaxID=185202 RepID=A0ACB9I5Q1_9ASTR|nr:hypothetical protein L1987_31055 [Smallanthus sonchifolius]